jgi:cyclase
MLKVRLIPTLLMRGVNLVKGERFDSWRSVGAPMQAVKVYNLREVDELILLDIAATPENSGPNVDMVETLASECFVPLTVGGGIRDAETVRSLLHAGADKVSINTAAYRDTKLVSILADRFGSQCVVASIDYRLTPMGPRCANLCGSELTHLHPVDWALEIERRGAGEILLTNIDRDGTLEGYDLVVLREVCAAVSIPIIASGGAKDFEDMKLAVQYAGASAVAASALFLFTQATPLEAKAHLAAAGVPVRTPYRSSAR